MDCSVGLRKLESLSMRKGMKRTGVEKVLSLNLGKMKERRVRWAGQEAPDVQHPDIMQVKGEEEGSSRTAIRTLSTL